VSEALVGMVVGGREDLAVMDRGAELLRELEVAHTIDVRSPALHADELVAWASGAADAGYEVLVAGDSGGAHLAALIAARTRLPVIGVPFRSAALGGSDALAGTAQASLGAPVATVGIDDARNAAVLACRILALTRPDLADRLATHLAELATRDHDHRRWPPTTDDPATPPQFGFHPH
jgi:5-(carboxyamino)imidazole ribonucleotide mutase